LLATRMRAAPAWSGDLGGEFRNGVVAVMGRLECATYNSAGPARPVRLEAQDTALSRRRSAVRIRHGVPGGQGELRIRSGAVPASHGASRLLGLRGRAHRPPGHRLETTPRAPDLTPLAQLVAELAQSGAVSED